MNTSHEVEGKIQSLADVVEVDVVMAQVTQHSCSLRSP